MKFGLPIKVCDFCLDQHKLYQKNLDNFKVSEKVEVSTCIFCGKSMCKDCVEISKKKIQGSPLSENGYYLCAECIQQQWYQGEYKNVSQKIFLKSAEKMKIFIQTQLQLYSLKQQIICHVMK